MTEPSRITQHYEQAAPSLVERLRAALAAAGFDDTQALSPADLAPLDQFHSRGLDATRELAGLLALDGSQRVLDIGSGLGGPSRYLASTFGCHVEGIDLSSSYVDAAQFLAGKTGLGDLTHYRQGNALALPFEDGAFDIAWTQHVAMNIADRDTLYREAHRVLRPGGRFAIFDVVAVSGEPLHFPVPWAADADSSFLVTPERMRGVLEAQGFAVQSWVDSSEAALTWFEARAKRQAQMASPPPLGLHLVMGPGFRDMTGNLARNLREGRAGLIQAVLSKA
ncbi:class I SAM-dependent methyltransferase [Burkholderia sp. Ac-20379]|uniref:class I SAM-dependent methyltransferase n=1 Tax=Burkholderia sp. Ac-20379 TaxID=2703900 RepID=UPI00197FBCAB|nr:class I SAM-dependent methyltransferase [Burkholderia sp. Ac-20379]MBN3725712.1 class I SAM-dependent methyltransferase [Burkholderia sp. Ac-20379]